MMRICVNLNEWHLPRWHTTFRQCCPFIFLTQFAFVQHTNNIHTMEANIFPRAQCHIHVLHAQHGSSHKLFTKRTRQLGKLCTASKWITCHSESCTRICMYLHPLFSVIIISHITELRWCVWFHMANVVCSLICLCAVASQLFGSFCHLSGCYAIVKFAWALQQTITATLPAIEMGWWLKHAYMPVYMYWHTCKRDTIMSLCLMNNYERKKLKIRHQIGGWCHRCCWLNGKCIIKIARPIHCSRRLSSLCTYCTMTFYVLNISHMSTLLHSSLYRWYWQFKHLFTNLLVDIYTGTSKQINSLIYCSNVC